MRLNLFGDKESDNIEFSNNYIKMCREANEIRDIKCTRKDEETTSYAVNLTDFVCIIYLNRFSEQCIEILQAKDVPRFVHGTELDSFWMPTFDQLLKIYQEREGHIFESLALLWLMNFVEDKVKADHGFCLKYKTKEEIALLWVMETCYNKNWNGEAWV